MSAMPSPIRVPVPVPVARRMEFLDLMFGGRFAEARDAGTDMRERTLVGESVAAVRSRLTVAYTTLPCPSGDPLACNCRQGHLAIHHDQPPHPCPSADCAGKEPPVCWGGRDLTGQDALLFGPRHIYVCGRCGRIDAEWDTDRRAA